MPPGVLRPGVEFGGGKFAAQIPNLFLNKGTADAPGTVQSAARALQTRTPAKKPTRERTAKMSHIYKGWK